MEFMGIYNASTSLSESKPASRFPFASASPSASAFATVFFGFVTL
jgi:hypothetical protein